MSDVRQRKPVPATAARRAEEEDTSKTKRHEAALDFEPNIFVLGSFFVAFTLIVGSLLFYKVDNSTDGPFATWVNTNFPAVDRALNNGKGNIPFFGVAAGETSDMIKLTEEELKAFDGTDKDKPIYLAINGTIFDVSVSPAFYGPGGHYHHFVGKDASRAWVTECWDEQDQFTWRMDDVEVMFLPKYLDEQLEDVSQGKWDPTENGGFNMPKEAMLLMAKKSMERFGTVTDGEKARRRVADLEEAKEKVQETLTKWVKFFSGSDKYQIVGEVILDTSRPSPPEPCEAALKKRPIKGGKLEGLMNSMASIGNMGGAKDGEEADGEEGSEGKAGDGMPAGMPESVKEQIRKAKEAREAREDKMPEAVKEKLRKAQMAKESDAVEDVDLSKDEL